MILVQLLTRQGCVACVQARQTVTHVCDQYPPEKVRCTEIDVDACFADQPRWRREYGDLLPVVLINGTQHSCWGVDAISLRSELAWMQGEE